MSTGFFARLCLVAICVMLSLCVLSCIVPRFQQAPRPSRRYTEQRQRQHAQERRQDRRRNHSPISWSGQ